MKQNGAHLLIERIHAEVEQVGGHAGAAALHAGASRHALGLQEDIIDLQDGVLESCLIDLERLGEVRWRATGENRNHFDRQFEAIFASEL